MQDIINETENKKAITVADSEVSDNSINIDKKKSGHKADQPQLLPRLTSPPAEQQPTNNY